MNEIMLPLTMIDLLTSCIVYRLAASVQTVCLMLLKQHSKPYQAKIELSVREADRKTHLLSLYGPLICQDKFVRFNWIDAEDFIFDLLILKENILLSQ